MEKHFLGKWNSKCKSPVVEQYLVWIIRSEKSSVWLESSVLGIHRWSDFVQPVYVKIIRLYFKCNESGGFCTRKRNEVYTF